ncbi:WD40 repeat-like protein, partial [Dichomitus squalens LYAD-421 SS1]
QNKRDEAMGNLPKAMDDLYGLVNKTGRFTDLDEYRKRLLKDMSKKTQECAEFIQDEARFTNFWIRTGSNVISGSRVDEKVREFTEAFVDLRRRFTEGGMLETEIRVANLADLSITNNLPYVRGAGLDSGRACLEGTRVKTLGVLREWVNNPKSDAPRVLFLLGGAGTGKSSVAHSIGVYLGTRRRLGSFFGFNRAFQADRPLTSVFSTIAHDLANWNSDFRCALAAVLHDEGHLIGSVDIAKQWEGLILKPLKTVTLVRPVLLVIDAFDESSSADAPERRLLLKHLTEGSGKLPPNFRILITSRPEHDVMRVVGRSNDDHLRLSHMILDDNKDEAMPDIECYVRHTLAPDDPEFEEPLDSTDVRELAAKAEGLFQWAATACRAILQKPAGRPLKRRFDLFMIAVSQGGVSSLDGLYRTILEDLFASDDQYLMEQFRSVMAQMLCASSPLSVESLAEICRLATGAQEDEVNVLVKDMGSLLSGIYIKKSPIRPHHTSFRDFLTDKGRSKEWFVDLAAGHPVMALGCFRVMNNRLSFNICRLKTSHTLNRDIADLEARLSISVPQSLSYAACNWKDHLATTHPPDLQQELSRFLRDKLLFWFELLSLLKSINRAAPSLEAALKGYDDAESDSSKELLLDAISFIRRFANAIAQSAPHVYMSALPFSPAFSRVRTNYLPRFPFLPFVDRVRNGWPQDQAILSRHTAAIRSVAYSPDGRRIVSGSADTTLRAWDAETGEAICELSCGCQVLGLAFSPDGRHVAAALSDSTVRIWDPMTGEVVGEPLRGHPRSVWCVAYSPDGLRLVSGDDDGRICVWLTQTLGMANQSIHDHASCVRCVAFSPNSQYIASGSHDHVVRVWDTIEGQAVGKPFVGHTDRVTSVLFSVDGLRIVSGSRDSTIRIWDFETQQMGPFVGHSDAVEAVSFSPDGHHVVSGSPDGTIRIWSVDESMSVESPGDVSSEWPDSALTSSVTSLAYSPDGRRIISGSEDGTINVWDADAGKSIGGHLKGHSDFITRVRFSPDGTRFVSASLDSTLCVWDSTTLRPLGELHGNTGWICDVDYSPDGRRIVSCDRIIRIWDAETYECLVRALVEHEGYVNCIAWSPDCKRIASGSDDGIVQVWDAETGRAVGEPFSGHEGCVNSVSWSKDGRHVMSSGRDGTIRFWNLERWAPAGEPLHGHTGHVHHSTYPPDKQRIVSWGEDRTIRMWDA